MDCHCCWWCWIEERWWRKREEEREEERRWGDVAMLGLAADKGMQTPPRTPSDQPHLNECMKHSPNRKSRGGDKSSSLKGEIIIFDDCFFVISCISDGRPWNQVAKPNQRDSSSTKSSLTPASPSNIITLGTR